jgi:hypothetical protein
MAPLAWSQTSSGIVGGTIPFVYVFDVTWDGAASSVLDGVNSTHYTQGYYQIDGLVATASVQANAPCQVAASIGDWTLPGNYPGGGNKANSGVNTDFNFRITGTPADMTVQNSFDSFQELTNVDQVVLQSVGTDGTALSTFGADAQVELFWAYDVAGSYSVTVTLTISEYIIP